MILWSGLRDHCAQHSLWHRHQTCQSFCFLCRLSWESETRILLSTKLPKWILSNHYSGVSKHSTISPYAWSQQGPPLMTSVSSSDLMKRSTRQGEFQVISGFNEINVWGLNLKACSIWQNINGIVMHSYGSDWLCKITSQPMNGTLSAAPKW